jgi:hypothetical protein
MTKKLFLLMCMLGIIGILSFSGCTSADAAEYTLTVSVGDGVSGTPATGSYTYGENDTVSYNYTAMAGYGNLSVTLDGAPAAASGVITMSTSHTLTVTATVDVRGKWTGLFIFEGESTYFEVTFTGGVLSGTTRGLFDWASGFGNGTYTISGNQADFTLRYSIGSADLILACTGTFSNANNMSGDWTFTLVGYAEEVGTWSLVRD